MKVQFNDGPAAVTVNDVPGLVAERGKPVDVPDRVGKQLLEQGWVTPSAVRKPAPTGAAIHHDKETK